MNISCCEALRYCGNDLKIIHHQLYDIYNRLGKDLNISVVFFILEDIALHKDLMRLDRIHPNAQVQMYIVENVWPYLLPMLQEKSQNQSK